MNKLMVFFRLPLGWFLLAAVTASVKAENFHFYLDPQASVLYQSSAIVDDYVVALSKYKKRDNRWSPKQSLRVAGQLTRYTIELAKHNQAETIFAFYREQLPDTAELLFHCSSRACGESNNWANDHFEVKQLYGTNAAQYYATFLLESVNNTKHYITIYTVRRGNRRLYTQLEVLSQIP
jgi:hypothetical protein